MPLSRYQKAVLQELDIEVFELLDAQSATKVSPEELDESDSFSTLPKGSIENVGVYVDTQTPIFQDVTSLLEPDISLRFKWRQEKNIDSVTWNDNTVVTSELDSLTIKQKREVWSLIQPFFNSSLWL